MNRYPLLSSRNLSAYATVMLLWAGVSVVLALIHSAGYARNPTGVNPRAPAGAGRAPGPRPASLDKHGVFGEVASSRVGSCCRSNAHPRTTPWIAS